MIEEQFGVASAFLSRIFGWVGFCLKTETAPTGETSIVLHLYLDRSMVGTWSGWLAELHDLFPSLVLYTVGAFRAADDNVPNRPWGVRSGSIISTGGAGARKGTLGFFAELGGRRFLVSANHVLFGNGNFGPNNAQVSVGGPPQVAARGVNGVFIDGQNVNFVDASWSTLMARIDTAPYITRGHGLEAFPFKADPFTPPVDAGQTVRLIGPATTGIVLPHAKSEFRISYLAAGMGLGAHVRFQDQFLVEGVGGAFAVPGDSGGLVVALVEGVYRPVGMVIGVEEDVVNPRFAVVTPIQAILKSIAQVETPGQVKPLGQVNEATILEA